VLTIKNPFPGIRPFRESDSENFFGRDHLTYELFEKLEKSRFVAIVGASGCGKSSLINAGLLPMLRVQDWKIVITRPQNNPIGNLAAELKKLDYRTEEGKTGDDLRPIWEKMIPNTLELTSRGIIDTYQQTNSDNKLLIIVDQFEELFQYKSKGIEERETALKYVRLLIEAANEEECSIHVIIVLRADFLGYCSQFKGLPELINKGQFLIPRLTRDQYRDAITRPLEKNGIRIASNIISQLLNDIEDDPDQLPILQHALMLTYQEWAKDEKKDDQLIDVNHYHASGGMSNSIDAHCEQIYQELKEKNLAQATKIIFQRLTEINLEGIEIRSPAKIKDLMKVANISFEETNTVVDAFRADGRNFLLPASSILLTENQSVDLSHECIMRKWGSLQHWIKEEEQERRDLLRLIDHHKNYMAKERGPLKDLTLANYVNWPKYISANEEQTKSWAKRYTSEFDAASSFISLSNQEAVRVERNRRRNKRVLYLSFWGVFLLAAGRLSYEYLSKHVRERESVVEAREVGARDLEGKLKLKEDSLTKVIATFKYSDQPDKQALYNLFNTNRELERENKEMKKQIENHAATISELKDEARNLVEIRMTYETQVQSLRSRLNSSQKNPSASDSTLVHKERLKELTEEIKKHQNKIFLLTNHLADTLAMIDKNILLEKSLKDYFAKQFADELKKNQSLLDEFEKKLKNDSQTQNIDPELARSIASYIAEQRRKLVTIFGKVSSQHRVLLYSKYEGSRERIDEFATFLRKEGYDGFIVPKPVNRAFFDNTGITILAKDQYILSVMKSFIRTTKYKNQILNEQLVNKNWSISQPDKNTTIVVLDY
jgi:energy-coupling factor transporter ATP-binding protein EcfA2